MQTLIRTGFIASLLAWGFAAAEPTWQQAVARWPEFRRPIIFLGLKDHPDEFGVMWNGNLTLQSPTATLADQKLFRSRRDDSLQVSFSAGEKPDFSGRYVDDRTTEASLAGGHLPLTRVRIHKDGVVLLEECFATNERGTGEASAWDTPAFLRIRFAVEEPGAGSGPIALWVQLARNHTSYEMDARRNVRIQFVAPPYARALSAAGDAVRDSRGLVVLAVSQPLQFYPQVPDSLGSVELREWGMDRNLCRFELPRRKGAAVDLILPFLPAAQETVAAARRLNHDEARAAITGYWKEEIGRGAAVEVPEEPLNDLWRFVPVISYMTADRYPNGDRVLKTSSHHYEAYWPTPMAMNLVTLAQQGYGKEVAAYLEPFLDKTRYRPVPNTGSSFHSGRGFISGPSEHLLISWVGDHGAILWAASEYYLLTRDESFLKRWLPSILEGLEWIASERENTKIKGGIAAGLMPAGRGTDDDRQANFLWVDGWIYRGLASACKVLQSTGHPDAARWARERDDYRASFQKALRTQLERTVTWTDPSGARIPLVPWELSQTNADNLNVFYVDGGPMFLGLAGLEDPNGDVMTWAMRWLTEGPLVRTVNPDWSTYQDRPALRFEMSTVEPCYSWNVYLRFLRDEREKFLEGFYSQAAGAVTRRFLGGSEHRDGILQLPVMNAVIASHMRNMLLFENGNGLELLRNSPSAWLQMGKEIRISGAPTYFGPASYRIRAVSGSRVEADIDTPSREKPSWIRVHLYHPQGKPLRAATVNGTPARVTGPTSIEIPNPSGRLKVEAEF